MKKTINNEENFLQILDAIGDMVLVKGPKSQLLWANQAFCRYYGMTNAQLKGLIDAPFSEPDNTQKFVKDDAYVFETGKILDIPEELVNRHDGVVRIFHTVKSPIFDIDKKVIMTVGIARDITERKDNEEKFKLERERSTYSAKMATLGEMAGGIAHEINTPLAVIMLLASQSSEMFSDEIPDLDYIKKNLIKIEQTAEKIAKIIVGLRTFSRDGKNDQLKTTKVADIIEDTLAFSRERIRSHSIELTVVHPDTDVFIECRATEISQVLLNLLNNSYDAIIESKSKKWIKVETKVINNQIEISVTDSGLGISKEKREKIFIPFFTTKELGKGTGLGLSISNGIVEAHGGSLSLDAHSPNTRFVLRFNLKA